MRVAVVTPLLVCALALPASGALTGPRQFQYRIAWNGIPAGNATVEVKEEALAGAPAYVVQATAATNAFVDIFWKFRGVARTTMLADGMVPLRFTYERQSNSLAESTWLDFDQSNQRAKSTYFKGDKRRDYAIDASGVTDPITAILHARAAGLEPGGELRYSVFTGESSYLVRLLAVGEEEITVPAGRFAALKLEPEVWKLRGTAVLDNRLRQATIWVSRDPTHVILRIRSEVFIGAVSLDLVELGVPS